MQHFARLMAVLCLLLTLPGLAAAQNNVPESERVAWGNWVQVPFAVDTVVSPAAVVYQGRLYVFTVNSDNRIYYLTMTAQGIAGATFEVPGDGRTNTKPCPVVYNNRLYLFYRATNGITYANILQDTLWSGPQFLSVGGTTNVAPAALVYDNKIWLFRTSVSDGNAANGGTIYINTYDGETWSEPFAMPGSDQITEDAPTVAVVDHGGRDQSNMWVAVRRKDNVIAVAASYRNFEDNALRWWAFGPVLQENGATATTDVPVGLATFFPAGAQNRQAFLFAKHIGATATIWVNQFIKYNNTPQWRGYYEVPPGGAQTFSAPTAVDFSGNLFLFARSIDNKMFYKPAF